MTKLNASQLNMCQFVWLKARKKILSCHIWTWYDFQWIVLFSILVGECLTRAPLCTINTKLLARSVVWSGMPYLCTPLHVDNTVLNMWNSLPVVCYTYRYLGNPLPVHPFSEEFLARSVCRSVVICVNGKFLARSTLHVHGQFLARIVCRSVPGSPTFRNSLTGVHAIILILIVSWCMYTVKQKYLLPRMGVNIWWSWLTGAWLVSSPVPVRAWKGLVTRLVHDNKPLNRSTSWIFAVHVAPKPANF